MKSKLVLLIPAFLFVTIHLAFSQDSLVVSDGDKAKAIVLRLTRELNLDNRQEEKVSNVIKKRFDAIAKARNNGVSAGRDAANQKAIEDLRKIFSTEQFDLFVKLRQEKQKAKEIFLLENPGYAYSEDDKDLDI